MIPSAKAAQAKTRFAQDFYAVPRFFNRFCGDCFNGKQVIKIIMTILIKSVLDNMQPIAYN